jgi:hypothetical protein
LPYRPVGRTLTKSGAPLSAADYCIRGYHVVVDQIALRELGDFVNARVAEDVTRAEENGDKFALSYYEGSRVLFAQVRRDVEERPWAHDEVGNFLLRSARLYRRHPHFRVWWS